MENKEKRTRYVLEVGAAHGSDDSLPMCFGVLCSIASCTTVESTCNRASELVLALALLTRFDSRHHRTNFNVVFRSQSWKTRKKRSKREKFMHWQKSGLRLKFLDAADRAIRSVFLGESNLGRFLRLSSRAFISKGGTAAGHKKSSEGINSRANIYGTRREKSRAAILSCCGKEICGEEK